MKKQIENEEFCSNAMLKLVNIKKDYIVSGNNEPVHALKGINLSFRKNEFVSILGHSGCGKTTLLNIVGGLDKYSDGDLIISGKSTKKFNDRDWDVYRNHRIGFIFQSYNLIPHQTILGNVELALTISGMSKKERIEQAKKALDRVGLANMYHKRPNQLSGGQCQRVAIARALVNEPEILLADEPTGALDSTTSKQIMDLISEISKEKLVIMVTHNPEIAKQYSTRIIQLLDGKVVADSNPFEDIQIKNEKVVIKNEKARMSFWTAFKLSARNLISKLKRTILVCVAGSIGIVGVSTVLAVSAGVHNYIDSMQDDMLSGNPVTISEVSYDLNGLISNMSMTQKVELAKEYGFVNVNSLIEYLIKQNNNLQLYKINNTITKEYIDYINQMPTELYAAMAFDYGIDISNNLYTNWDYDSNTNNDNDLNNHANMSISAITKMYTAVLKETEFKDYAAYVAQLDSVMAQAPNNNEYILSQYDLLDGKIAEKENEIMIVIDKDNALTDITLAQLGYFTQQEFINIVYKATNDEQYAQENDKQRFKFEELRSKKFTWYPNDIVFTKNETSPTNLSQFTYNHIQNDSFKDGVELNVVGILQPKESISYGCLRAGFYYTEALTKHILEKNLNSEIVAFGKEQKEETITSGRIQSAGMPMPIDAGITYKYSYTYEGQLFENQTGYVGNEATGLMNLFASMLPGGSGGTTQNDQSLYTITTRQLGGVDLANYISIYPLNFEEKDKVTSYLDKWNDENLDLTINGKVIKGDQRSEIKYADNLQLVINMINTMIDIITYALIVFTALSLLVSTVMIGIITYVSVVERIKEIGVIRSLGGRKKDVSALFIAETFIIGLASGLFGILITIGISGIINLIVGHFSGIYTIAQLPVSNAIIMICISVMLTLVSGLFPARAAARKDPVEALRTE